MTETEVNYLDDEITVLEQEPTPDAEGLKELVEMLGVKQVVEEVISNLRYRNKHPRVYKKVSETLKDVLPRPQKGTTKLKDGTVRPIYVSHIEHCRALFKADPAKTEAKFQEIAKAEPLFVKGERSGFGGKISAGALLNANNFFAEGTEKVEAVVKVIEETVPSYKVLRDEDDEVTPEALARGLMALGKHVEKTAKQAANALVEGARPQT